jgi:hypothetical protein
VIPSKALNRGRSYRIGPRNRFQQELRKASVETTPVADVQCSWIIEDVIQRPFERLSAGVCRAL